MIKNLSFAFRFYRKRPALTLTILLILSVGLGMTAAVFSVLEAVLLKPLPYADSAQIVIPWRQTPPGVNLGYREIPWGVSDFHQIAKDSRVFDSVAAMKGDSFNLTGIGRPVLIEGARVSADFFRVLATRPAIGRWFLPEEDQVGRDHEVILSDALWKERFGGRPDILGRILDLNGTTYVVVGVMPSGFQFPSGAEMPSSFDLPSASKLWVPLAAPASVASTTPDDLIVMARLWQGVTYEQSQAEMNVLSHTMETENRAPGWYSSKITPLSTQISGDIRLPLILIQAAVFVVLLVVCINLANLLVISSIERRTEFTVRAALGAGRSHLIRQLMTESLLLAGAGGTLGIGIAYASTFLVRALGPTTIPRLQQTVVDGQVIGFVLILALATGLFFGLAPLFSAFQGNLSEALNERGIGAMRGSASGRFRNTLTVLQIALALVLMIAASLLTETLSHLLRTDGGFNAEHVLTFELSLPSLKYASEDQIVGFYQRVLQTLPSVPGVQASGIVKTIPLTGATEGSGIRIPNRPATSRKVRTVANYNIASPGYFAAAGTPLLQGREFGQGDTADSTPVVVINDAMAKTFWPGENPLGRQVGLGSPRFPLMTIVGIVANTKHLSLREDPGPEMYVPFTQKPYPSMAIMSVVVRTKIEPTGIISDVDRAIHSIDSDMPLAKVLTLNAIRSNSTVQLRFAMIVLSSFCTLTLVLACVGMYGLISYSTAQRTQEIGVRMALGADRGNIMRLMLGQSALLAGIGICAGIMGAFACTRMMSGFLYGIRPSDPVTFGIASCVLLGLVLLASYIPSFEASKVSPVAALRYK